MLCVVTALTSSPSLFGQEVKLFKAERKSGYLEVKSFTDHLARNWISLRTPLRDNELGVGTSLYLQYLGSIYHPRLLEWTADGRFTFKRRRFTNSTIDFTDNFTEYLQDYTLGATIFKERSLSARLFAARNTSTADADFSPSTNVNTRGYGGALTLVKGHLVQTLSANRNKYVSEGVINNEEKRSVVVYDATFRRDKLTSSANYEYNDINFVTNGSSFTGHSVRVQNYLNLDRRGRHTFSLGGNYYERNGANPNNNGQVGIATHQQITDALQGTGSVSYRRNEVKRSVSETGSLSAGVSHQLYQSLTSSLLADAYRTTFNQGRETEYHPTASLQYRKLTFFGSLRLRYLLGYRKHEEKSFQGAGASTRLQRERFLYFPGTPLILSGTSIDTLSIEVSSPDSGALFNFQNGIDYHIVQTGARVEIEILLTGSVKSGDSLQVTYNERFNNSFTFEEAENRYGTTIEILQLLQISADHTSQRQTLLSGIPSNQLDNTRDDRVSVSWQLRDAQLKAEYQRRKTIRNPFKRRALSGQITRVIARNMTFTTTSTYSVTDFTDQTGRSKLITVNGSLWRRFSRELNTRFRGSFVKRIGRRDDGYSWVLSSVTRYNIRLLTGELRLDYYNRKVDLVGDENRFSVNLSVKRQL